MLGRMLGRVLSGSSRALLRGSRGRVGMSSGAGSVLGAPVPSVSQSLSGATSSSSSSEDLRSELVDTYLNLEELEVNLFRGKNLMGGLVTSPWVYGGQVIGQALVAAVKTVEPRFHPHSLHSYFIKAGDKTKPIVYMVDRLRDGKSFCTRFVKAVQKGETICSVELSFHREEPDSISHQAAMPPVPKPEELENADVLLQRILDDPNSSPEVLKVAKGRLANYPSTFDIRPVSPDAWLRIKPVDIPPKLFIWVKCKGQIGEDWRLNHCAAAFISDSTMIGTALLPHVAAGFQLGMTFSLDHSIWIHRHKFRMDDWVLYETESPIASGARAMIHGKLWDRSGQLVLSTAQEGLIRPKLPALETPPTDGRASPSSGKKHYAS